MTFASRSGQCPSVDWAVASQPLSGFSESGDLEAVAAFEGGVLLAVIDGLGHGSEAARAARAASASLLADPTRPVMTLMTDCHEAIRETRGAVASVASIDSQEGMLAWTGVGNIETQLLRRGIEAAVPGASFASPGGVVGYRLPRLRESRCSLQLGDLLILATDGIAPGFTRHLDTRGEPSDIAERIFAAYRRLSDDALVLVARYLGAHP